MAILETAITYKGNSLLEEQYYSTENVLDKSIRNGLLQAIKNLTNEAFGEDIQSFSLGDYSIIMASHEIDIPKLEKTMGNTAINMYCIVDKQTEEKTVIKAINNALFQFMNRYSWNDIREMKLKKFKKFTKRLNKIFGDLTLKSEDRFKSLF